MSHWKRRPSMDELNAASRGTMVEHLGIEFTQMTDNALVATMPVDARTHQPYGILHGGASVALAETLGSMGASLCLDFSTHYPVGLEINANHLRSIKTGTVTGTATPIHVGRSTQVWKIDITDEQDRLICVSRITLAVLERGG